MVFNVFALFRGLLIPCFRRVFRLVLFLIFLTACRNLEKAVDDNFLSVLFPDQMIRDQGYVKFDSLGNITVEFNNTHFKNNPAFSELSYIGVFVFPRGADVMLNCCSGNASVCGSASRACLRGVGFSQDLGFLGRRFIFREPPQVFNPNADKYYMKVMVSDRTGVPRDYQGEYTLFSGPTNPVGDREMYDLYIGVYQNLFDPVLRRLRPINLEAQIGTQTYYSRVAPDFLSPRIPIESRFFSQRPEDPAGNWYKIPSMAVWSRPPPLDPELDKRGRIRINEIGNAIGGVTANDFIELYNPSDFEIPLDDVFIQRYTSNACSTLISATQKTNLTGFSIPPRGFLTLARPGHTLSGIDGTFESGLNIGSNDCVALTKGTARIRTPFDERVIDFVAMSDPNNQNQVRGRPTNPVFDNSAISRCPDGADSRINAEDFFQEAPTPGLANLCQFAPQPEPIQNAQPGEILITEVLHSPDNTFAFEGGSIFDSPACWQSDVADPLQRAGSDNFVELVNNSNKAFNLGGARIWYVTSGGNFFPSSGYYTFPSVVLNPGEHIAVVSQDAGCYNSLELRLANRKIFYRSSPSVTSPVSFSGTQGSVILTRSNNPLGPTPQAGPAPNPETDVLDYMGWGDTPPPIRKGTQAPRCFSPRRAIIRKRIGGVYQNTNDNGSDFECALFPNGTPGRAE